MEESLQFAGFDEYPNQEGSSSVKSLIDVGRQQTESHARAQTIVKERQEDALYGEAKKAQKRFDESPAGEKELVEDKILDDDLSGLLKEKAMDANGNNLELVSKIKEKVVSRLNQLLDKLEQTGSNTSTESKGELYAEQAEDILKNIGVDNAEAEKLIDAVVTKLDKKVYNASKESKQPAGTSADLSQEVEPPKTFRELVDDFTSAYHEYAISKKINKDKDFAQFNETSEKLARARKVLQELQTNFSEDLKHGDPPPEWIKIIEEDLGGTIEISKTDKEKTAFLTDTIDKLKRGEALTQEEILVLAKDLVENGLNASVIRQKVLSLTGKETFRELLQDRDLAPGQIAGLEDEKVKWHSPNWLKKTGVKSIATLLAGGALTAATGGAWAVFLAGMAGSSLATLGVEKWRDVAERKLKKQEVQGIVDNTRDSIKIAFELQEQNKKGEVTPKEINGATLKLIESLQSNSEKSLEARKELSSWKHNLKWAGLGILGGVAGAGVAIGALEILTGAYHEMVKQAISQAETGGKTFVIRNHAVQFVQGLWHWMINGSDVATAAASGAPLHGIGHQIGTAAVGQAHIETVKTAATGIMNAEVYKIITQEVIHKYLGAIAGLLTGILSGEGIRSLWQGMKEAKKTEQMEVGAKSFGQKWDFTKTKLSAEMPKEPTPPPSPISPTGGTGEVAAPETPTEAPAEPKSSEPSPSEPAATTEKIETETGETSTDGLEKTKRIIENKYRLTPNKYIKFIDDLEDRNNEEGWIKKDTDYRFIGMTDDGYLVFEEKIGDEHHVRLLMADRLMKFYDDEHISIFRKEGEPVNLPEPAAESEKSAAKPNAGDKDTLEKGAEIATDKLPEELYFFGRIRVGKENLPLSDSKVTVEIIKKQVSNLERKKKAFQDKIAKDNDESAKNALELAEKDIEIANGWIKKKQETEAPPAKV